ncbi:hypothetical protein QPK24_22805 [Paenibacillus polygoni]|uniref:Uncharacterized protein n=1 Tax=Paenibacillus polygoni TaxID=3050112 RepID=A0ABY8X0U4_9BACL|nr:hypothetical protein [Paenibacillus polygoni]WIV19110.1 hypothetical protein QPK24_22805 [Paenibacillus polygoni]
MPTIKTVMRTHLVDYWLWLIVPLIVLMSSFVVNLIISISIGSFTTGGLLSIYGFMMSVGIAVIPMNFSFSLSFGIRRKDYFLGTISMFLLFSLLYSTALTIVREIEQLTSGWGTGLHFFDVPFLSSLSFLHLALLNFVVISHLFLFGFVMSSIARRFGKLVLISLILLIVIVLGAASVLVTYWELWDEIGKWVMTYQTDIIWFLAPLTLLYAFLSYVWLRKSTI